METGIWNSRRLGGLSGALCLLALSPRRRGHRLSPILFVTGDKDDRCNPAHVRKMAARLQGRPAQKSTVIVDYSQERGHSPVLPLTFRRVARADGNIDLLGGKRKRSPEIIRDGFESRSAKPAARHLIVAIEENATTAPQDRLPSLPISRLPGHAQAGREVEPRRLPETCAPWRRVRA